MLRELKKFYNAHGRHHLPWRTTRDPYKILVSEIMLQQTQVDRVVPYYIRWIKKYPTAKRLAEAKLIDVLKEWQGLGYNRRARYLHETAKILSEAESPLRRSRGRVHLSGAEELFAQLKLPGVGPYTRAAVEAFAFNKPTVFIETNIRSVFLYFFFAKKNTSVADKEILMLVERELKKSKMQPRDFYAALMDYGSHLKKQGVRLNHKSAHYTKQSRFEGSRRQARAKKLRALIARGAGERVLLKALK